MKAWTIALYTFREGIARKSILVLFGIGTFFLLIGALVAVFTPGNFQAQISGMQQGAVTDPVTMIEAGLVSALFSIAMLLSVFTTAGIIPGLLEKGAVDLLLSKPVSRGTVLAGAAIGATLIVAANVAYYLLGTWLIIGFKTGVWHAAYLAAILPIVAAFVVLYGPMAALGVASRSTALVIVILYVFTFIVDPFLSVRQFWFTMITNGTAQDVISSFYYVLPKIDGMGKLTVGLVSGAKVTWMPLWSGALFSAAMFGLAWWQFERRDF
jgi:ABC-2 type transport system permease protein